MKMIQNMFAGTVLAMAGGFVLGVAHSSFRHYYHRYADEQDLRNHDGQIQEVVIVADETKKTRGSKK
ncbi:MAG TPA: hypothetical protein HA340_05600 [Candidatus Thalassarchaeaceae archaeon]|jgi:hypothetical protein|nr:MAG TPA: hypothetical protein D7H97_05570 [Candidatus Poseidoniales archaeon]HIH83403.1 hypothetical protein [Candidatus Thalassarchaeaceae archaeon]|tara:strand:+ start:262 stop:462 length:201 start_codon:yes stop_codon:yes gene_type:complete